MNGDIATEKPFMHTAKGAQESAQARPQPFNCIAMNFAEAIAIRIACPFVLSMTDRIPITLNALQSPTAGPYGFEQRGTPRDAGQRSSEQLRPLERFEEDLRRAGDFSN